MPKIELLEYVKKWNPYSPIPESVMTMGELADLLQEKEDLLEGMKLMMSVQANGEISQHPADEAQQIENVIDDELGTHVIISGGEVLELSYSQTKNNEIPF